MASKAAMTKFFGDLVDQAFADNEISKILKIDHIPEKDRASFKKQHIEACIRNVYNAPKTGETPEEHKKRIKKMVGNKSGNV